jgi:hypothetical protein
MSPQKMEIAIAESMGMELKEHYVTGFGMGESWIAPNGDIHAVPPSYTTDLNACHEFEKSLDEVEKRRYARLLHHSTNDCDPSDYLGQDYGCLHAPAAQRCDAYCEVKGLLKGVTS